MAHIDCSESKKIKAMIDKSKMKHQDICAELGLSNSSFSRRYHGQFRWKTEELKRLAKVCGCSFYDLI